MKTFGVFLCLAMTIILVNCKSINKRQAENEVSPSNEVFVLETEDDGTADDERSDRDKRKIGVVKLGVTNGILGFVFGKLDAFLDAKTRALSVLDESNRAKNVAFGIDPTQSATSQFVTQFLQQKVQAGTNSIGPVVNGATTFLSSAASGLTNALAGKVGSLSSLSGGLSQGAAQKPLPPKGKR